jgi:hypothetical protein
MFGQALRIREVRKRFSPAACLGCGSAAAARFRIVIGLDYGRMATTSSAI